MKKAKLLIIPLLSTFLAGCASSSIAGQYVFQMGKTKGSHFGIYLTLTDEVVKDESQATIGKKLSFQFALMSGTDTPQVEANAETAAQVEAPQEENIFVQPVESEPVISEEPKQENEEKPPRKKRELGEAIPDWLKNRFK